MKFPIRVSSLVQVLTLNFSVPLIMSGPAYAQAATEYQVLLDAYGHKHYGEVVADGTKIIEGQKLVSTKELAATRVLVSLAAFKTQPLLNSVTLFRQAYEMSPTSVSAANYGAVEILVGDRALSTGLFEKSLSLDPNNVSAHLGRAELFALDPKKGVKEALEELAKTALVLSQAKVARAPDDLCQNWLALGDHYLLFKDAGRALDAFLQAERLSSGLKDELKTPIDLHLKQAIFRAALIKGDNSLAQSCLNGVLASDNLSVETYTLAASKLCTADADGEQLAQRLYQKALQDRPNDDDLFYALGRGFATAGLDKQALTCLKLAHERDPGDSKFTVAYAAMLSHCGEPASARRELTALLVRAKSQEPTPQRNMAHGLALAGMNYLQEFQGDWAASLKHTLGGQKRPVYKTAYADLLEIKCHCRLLTMQYTLQAQPGVAFSFIPDDKTPVAFVVYDSSATSPAKIWPALKGEANARPLGRSETATDFYQLVKTALDYAEAPYRPLHPYYVFNTLPLELAERD